VDVPEVESAVFLAGGSDLLAPVALRQRHEAATGTHKPVSTYTTHKRLDQCEAAGNSRADTTPVDVGVHSAGGGGSEGARGVALRRLGGSRVVHDVIAHVLGHALALLQTLQDLRVRNVSGHNQRAYPVGGSNARIASNMETMETTITDYFTHR
jgi:hypothetical protein